MTTTTITAPTGQDITAAEQELAEAERVLAAARTSVDRGHVRSHATLNAAHVRYDAAHGALTALRNQREQAQQLAARKALEKRLAKDSAKRADELAASRDQMTTTLEAAQDALVAAFKAVEEHNVLLAQHAGEMAAQGLAPILDGHPVGADARARVAFLGGEYWREISPGIVVAQLVERVRLARLDPRNYEMTVRRFGQGNTKNQAAAEVLAVVPAPEKAPTVAPTVARHAPVECPPAGFASEREREQAARDREVKWTPIHAGPGGQIR